MSLERWHLYTKRIPAVPDAAPRYFYNNVIPIRDLPGPYEMRALSMYPASGGKAVRCKDGKGDYFQSDFVDISIMGDGQEPMPIWPPKLYPYNGVFSFDLFCPVTEGFTDLWPIMWGVHILAGEGETLYPEKFRETPYTHQITVTVADGDLCLLRDHNGQALSNIPMPLPALFSLNQANRPITPSPELVIPPGRAFTLDIVSSPTGVRKIPVYLKFNTPFAVRQLLMSDPTGDNTSYQLNFGGALLNAI